MALTSNSIYTCNILAQNKRTLDISDKNISNISIDKSGISYVYKQISDTNNTIQFVNKKYSEIGMNKLHESVKDFIYYNSLAYVVQNKEINVYNRWGMHIKNYKSSGVITTPVIFNDGKNIAIVYSNKIVIVGI